MRRSVWFVFVPAILVGGFLVVLLFANFFKALSLGHVDPYELEFGISRIVVWLSVFLSGFAWLTGKAFQWRKKTSETGSMLREISDICLAIFFGGSFALAHSWQAWWTYPIVALPYLVRLFFVELRCPQKTRQMRWWRIGAWIFVPTLTFFLIRYAAFS